MKEPRDAICDNLDALRRQRWRELETSRRSLLSLWYVLHPDLAQKGGGG